MINILKKLNKIMGEVGYIKKDKTNNFSKYDYASEEAIKKTIQPKFVENNLMLVVNTSNPRVLEGTLYLDVDYKLYDTEIGNYMPGKFVASGQSRDEKGNYSAVTGAIKYILTTTLLIPTGNDPEDDSNDKPSKGRKVIETNPVRSPKEQAMEKKDIAESKSEKDVPQPTPGANEKLKEQKLKWILALVEKKKIEDKDYKSMTVEQLTEVMDNYRKGLGK